MAAVSAVAVLVSSAALTTAASADTKGAAPVYAERGWTKLSTGPGLNISTPPALLRFRSKLIVTWQQGSGSVYSRLLGSDAKTIGSISTVVTGWSEIDADQRPFLQYDVPRVAFAGSHSLDSTDPYNGPVVYALAPNGADWTPGLGSLTQSPIGTDGFGIGVFGGDGDRPITVYASGGGHQLAVHDDVDVEVPAATPDLLTPDLQETQDVSAAKDLTTGVGYAVWYSGRTETQGIHAINVYPTIGAPTAAAPLSRFQQDGSFTSNNPSQATALTSRIGGGVWAAYTTGYDKTSALVLWNVESGRTLVMHRPGTDLQYVNLSAGPDGRLWVSWIQGGTVYATRTNPWVTRFGVVRAVTAPGEDVTRTAGDGTLGPLDVAITSRGSGSTPAIYSARFLEGLAVGVSPRGISHKKGGSVVVTVSDAGLAVADVTVTVGGKAKTTNAAGQVTFAVPALSARGAHSVSATEDGWYPGKASFRVG